MGKPSRDVISLSDNRNGYRHPILAHYTRINIFAVSIATILYIQLFGLFDLFPFSIPTQAPGRATFHSLAEHCTAAEPIGPSEFYSRQRALANALHHLNASAYIAEPGPNAGYFANISSLSWKLSERPLLLIIEPVVRSEGVVDPRISVLTPSFEATRAKLLTIPSEGGVSYPEWPESANPYQVAAEAVKENSTIFVDSSIRHFIVDGLRAASSRGVEVRSAPLEIRRLREQKSSAEIALMNCVNEVTLLALRKVRGEMYIGIRESQTRVLMQNALRAAGLINPWALVLFGENAALPHGSGTDRVLGKSDFVLIDTGGALHGYQSDLTRTFALSDSQIGPSQLDIWYSVQSAQSAAASAARAGVLTGVVDDEARSLLTERGYGRHFTHRLGHGIGLEVHEAPYLVANSQDVILPGHSFSNEPGVYIEGEVGVRLEDCFYINEVGESVFFTAKVGGAAVDPWHP